MASHYGWIIDKDHLDGDNEHNEVGTIGPSDISDLMMDQLKNTDRGTKFRLYDDDDVLYYSGRYLGELDGETGDPLVDFGMPNAGCTYMDEYVDGKWVTTLA